MTSARRRHLGTAASLCLLAALLAATAWFVRHHWAEFQRLEIADPLAAAPLLVLAPLTAVAHGLQLRHLVRPFGVRLAPREWFGLAVVTAFYNMLTPLRGGLLAKGAYLHRRHGLSLSGFLAVTAGVSIVSVCVAGLTGVAGLLLGAPGGAATTALAGFFAAMTAATLGLMAFAPRFGETGNPLLARVVRIAHGWRAIRDDAGALAATLLATGLQFALSAAAVFFSFALIGVSVGAGTSLVLSSLTLLSVFVGITPAGLGVTEAAAVFGGIALGVTPAQSLAAAVARRLATSAVILVLGPCFTLTLLRGGAAAEERP